MYHYMNIIKNKDKVNRGVNMVLHNAMEDLVISYLDEILENKKNICRCNYCKTDMAAYALNRVKPMYVVSSRGVIHTENNKRNAIQEEIDIYSIVAESIDVVSNLKRHEVNHNFKKVTDEPCAEFFNKITEGGNYYNFPQIVGRVLDGSTIMNLTGAKVSLYYENGNHLVPMCNSRWQNPIEIISQMEGTYTFWPIPIKAEKTKTQKDFYFNLEVSKDGYEITRKYFYLRTLSINLLRHAIKKEDIFYLDDIYLSPKELN